MTGKADWRHLVLGIIVLAGAILALNAGKSTVDSQLVVRVAPQKAHDSIGGLWPEIKSLVASTRALGRQEGREEAYEDVYRSLHDMATRQGVFKGSVSRTRYGFDGRILSDGWDMVMQGPKGMVKLRWNSLNRGNVDIWVGK